MNKLKIFLFRFKKKLSKTIKLFIRSLGYSDKSKVYIVFRNIYLYTNYLHGNKKFC